MDRKVIIVLVMAVFAIMQLGSVPLAQASGTSLNSAEPYNTVLTNMVQRGLLDYCAQFGHFPQDAGELEAGGFTPYLLPANAPVNLMLEGGKAHVDTNGNEVYMGGCYLPADWQIFVRQPSPNLVEYEEMYVSVDGDPGNREYQEFETPSFPGAQWLAAGYSWPEVEQALRVDRIVKLAIHGIYYYSSENGNLPGSLADLEAYLGYERNQLAWQGVTECFSADEALSMPGGLYIGWDGGDFVIRANYGTTLFSETYKQSDSGDWVTSEKSGYAYY